MSLSEGEKAYRDVFQFAPFVVKDHVPKLKDLLYKFAHNLSEAYDYLEILEYVNGMGSENKNELAYRIHGMSLQCFALSLRKLTDRQSQRSARKLVEKVYKPELKQQELDSIESVYGHYEKFLNKFVAHQDNWSISDGLAVFPDNDVIEADLKYLNDLYDKVCKKICTSYIGVSRKSRGYGPMLDRLT